MQSKDSERHTMQRRLREGNRLLSVPSTKEIFLSRPQVFKEIQYSQVLPAQVMDSKSLAFYAIRAYAMVLRWAGKPSNWLEVLLLLMGFVLVVLRLEGQ